MILNERSPVKNQQGVVTTEFLFAFVIAGGLSALLFSVTYTLAVVEITQYVAFSSARAFIAAHKTPELQRQAAIDKYKQLTTGKTAIGSLYQNGWFEIAKPDQLDIRGGGAEGKFFNEDLAGGSDMPDRNWFQGVSIPLTARILNIRLPLLGPTDPEADDNSFRTRLNAILIREPSQFECQDFMDNQRRNALGSLPSAQTYYEAGAYVPMEDNGC